MKISVRLLAAAVVAAFPVIASAQVYQVYPYVEYVEYDSGTHTLKATFGYVSMEAEMVTIHYSSRNFFLPDPQVRRVAPTLFFPGVRRSVFTTTFPADGTGEWRLLGISAHVVNDPALYPQPPAPSPLATAFQVQGRLQDAGTPYSGTADIRLFLFDAPTTGTMVHAPVTVSGATATDGFFASTFTLSSAAALAKDQLYFQFETRTPAWDGSGAEPAFANLSARQRLLPVPQAIRADTARYAETTAPVTALKVRGSDDQALGTDSAGNVWISRQSGPLSVNYTFQQPLMVGSAGTPGNGAYLSTGGVWTNASDVNKKTNFQEVRAAEILEKVAQLPIKSWTYRNEPDTTRHLGPTAQDFRRAFGLGDEDITIGTVDADGVSLTAIKALYEENRELHRKVDTLEARLEAIEKAQETKP